MAKFSYTKIPQKESDSSKSKNSVFSIISFGWLSNLLKTAKERSLGEDDLKHPSWEISTDEACQKFRQFWKLQLKSNNPKLWKVFIQGLDKFQVVCVLLAFSVFTFCLVMQPVVLNLLIKELAQSTLIVDQSNQTLIHSTSAIRKVSWPAVLYVAGLSILCLTQAFAKPQTIYIGSLLSATSMSGLTGLVHQKILSTKRYHLDGFASGHIINLVSKDLEILEYFFGFLPFLLTAPVHIITVAVLLWQMVGKESLVCVFYAIVFLVAGSVMGKLWQRIRKTMTKRSDLRLKLVCDVIAGIRVIKMSVWEELMDRLIGQARRKELQTVLQSNILRATFFTLTSSFISNASFLAVLTLIYSGHVITARSIFTILSFMTIYPAYLYGVWTSLEFLQNTTVTIERIQRFLLSGESSDSQHNIEHDDIPLSCQMESPRVLPELCLSKVTSTLVPSAVKSDSQDKNNVRPLLLNKIDLHLKGPALVAVIGKIGSGKSSLLNVILGELPLSQGKAMVRGTTAFVPQSAWMFSGTVRDNILFGRDFDKKRYDDVVKACALDKDFQILSHGDLTYVGERGVRLSGGQRARVNLARAVYYDADVYLLDDPLSAIDSKVGRHVFDECVVKMLSNRLRVLVTHHLHYLKHVDKVVVMENGSIAKQGTFDEIELSDKSLDKIMKTMQKEKDSVVDVHDKTEKMDESLSSLTTDENNQMEEEEKYAGKISYKIYWKYVRSGSNVIGLAMLLLLGLIAQCLANGSYFWLSHWAKLPPKQQQISTNLYVYIGISLCSFFSTFMFIYGLFTLCLNASRKLHSKMLSTILRCPIRFFDTNPPGRIVNRFARDISVMDELVIEFFSRFVTLALTCTFDMGIISVTNPILVIAILPVVYFVWSRVTSFLQASREVGRLMAISGSHVYENFVQTIEGAAVIRAFRAEKLQKDKMLRSRDGMNKALLMVFGLKAWMSLRIDFIIALYVIFAAFVSVLTIHDYTLVGLIIFYAIKLSSMTEIVFAGGNLETSMTSVERVIHYTELQKDPGYDLETHPPDQWPSEATVSFNDVTLTYYPGAPQALKGINLNIQSGEKIGIVGRTGAGKSSIISALFRLPQVHSGSIVIDQVVIENLNVQDSRNAIGCIPQDPFLFMGSLRFNLDPTGNCPTSELWSILEQVQLKSLVESIPEGLEHIVKEGGSNFSVGQRQLFCLARALLQNKKIIILDEATANVDFATDKIIQDTIKNQLQEQTVLAIAHRLDTVLDYDRVVVIEEGKVVETGEPHILLEQEKSLFNSMYRASSISLSNTKATL